MGNSLAVLWLRFHASTAGGEVSIPGWGTRILHAAQHSQKNKQTKTKQNKKPKQPAVHRTLRVAKNDPTSCAHTVLRNVGPHHLGGGAAVTAWPVPHSTCGHRAKLTGALGDFRSKLHYLHQARRRENRLFWKYSHNRVICWLGIWSIALKFFLN